jgi:hypothetical protein
MWESAGELGRYSRAAGVRFFLRESRDFSIGQDREIWYSGRFHGRLD